MFKLKIITPDATIYEGESNSLSLNTDEGMQVILTGHAPYMSKVEIGELKYNLDNGETIFYAVASGFLQCNDNNVFVLVDNATKTEEIDLEKAEEAKKRAEEIIKNAEKSQDLQRILNQLKLANLHLSLGRKHKNIKASPKQEL